jgi:hypothetical protein
MDVDEDETTDSVVSTKTINQLFESPIVNNKPVIKPPVPKLIPLRNFTTTTEKSRPSTTVIVVPKAKINAPKSFVPKETK